MPGKIILFIASEKGYTAFSAVVMQNYAHKIGAVVTFKETDVAKSWDNDIREECIHSKIPFYFWADIKNNMFAVMQEHDCKYAVTISWKYLLPVEINKYLKYPPIVFHDSLLPKYRGFSPTPTAIMCGETEIGVTAILANEQVDQGEILVQKSVYIPETMYIEDIISKQSALCADMLIEIIQKIEVDALTGVPQNEDDATYSIWRNIEDCHIDWNKSAKEIYDFVRAVGSPYPGAFTFLNGEKIYIKRTEIAEDLKFIIRDCGKIWRIADNQPEVICGKGILRIVSAAYEDGEGVAFHRVRCRLK